MLNTVETISEKITNQICECVGKPERYYQLTKKITNTKGNSIKMTITF